MGAALPLAGETDYAVDVTLDVPAAPIAAAATSGTVASALSAISAAGAATAAAATNLAMGRFLDELSPHLARPMTMHQREVLAESLIELVDARIAAARLD
jgi:hypothetical protein